MLQIGYRVFVWQLYDRRISVLQFLSGTFDCSRFLSTIELCIEHALQFRDLSLQYISQEEARMLATTLKVCRPNE